MNLACEVLGKVYVWLLFENGLYQEIRENLGDDLAWSILESVGYGLIVVGTNGLMLFTNPAYAEMIGYPPEEIIGRKPRKFVYQEDDEIVKTAYIDRAQNKTTTYELRMVRKDGRIIHTKVTGVPNHQNEHIYSVAIIEDITARKEAEIREQKQKNLVEALQDTATKLNSTLELEELFDHILDHMERVVPHDGATIFLIENNKAKAVRLSIKNQAIKSQELMNTLSVPLDTTPVFSNILESENPKIIADVNNDPEWVVWPGFEWMRSFAAAPILSNGQKIGLLAVLSTKVDLFKEEHAVGLQAFADQAGLAVKNARLFNHTKKRAQRLLWVNEMSVAMNLKRDVDEIAQVAVQGLAFALDVDQVSLSMFDLLNNRLTVIADNPALNVASLQGQSFHIEANLPLKEALENGELFTSFDAVNDPIFEPNQPLIHRRQIKSTLIAPLIVRDQLIGSITFDMTQVKHRFSEEEINLAQTFANLIAARIDLAQVLQSERLRRRELEAVQNATLSLAMLLTLPQALEAILKSLASLFIARSADIFLCEEGALQFGLGINSKGITDKPFAPPRPDGLTYNVARTGELLFIEDSHAHPLFATAPEDWGRFAIVGLPLKIGNEIVGVLNVSYRDVHYFAPFEKHMLLLFANQAAIAIHNAKLHEKIQDYALELEDRVMERTEELSRERNRLQTVLDSAGEAIYFTDVNGRIQYTNLATEKVTGYKLADVFGENASIWRGITARKILDHLDEATRQGKKWHGEVVNRHKNGSLYDANLNLSPLRNVDGNHVGYVGVLRDITIQKELARLQDQFVSRIGHELRTPLTNISMYLELLKRGNPEKQDRYMEILGNEMARLQKLVDGFLELSRLDAESTKPIPLIPTNMHVIVSNVINYWMDYAHEKGVVLKLDDKRPLPFALASPSVLHDALSPIIENAIQYSPENGRVELKISQKMKNEEMWIVCEIADQGPGIHDDEMSRIFDRFFRGEVTTNYKTAGVGLGLAISQANVNNIGGIIQIESTVDEGTVFSVWVKVAQ